MNEIIPLKKDIIFKTKIGQISNISLDHDYKIENDLVIGSVDISGSYKMTEASILEEDFYYSIPFSIAISKKVLRDSIKIEIDDFDYSINKDVLSVKINLCFSCEEEINKVSEEDMMNEYFNDIDLDNIKEENIEISSNNEINDNITNITNNIINTNDKYYTYKVYIVRKGDTLESISNKYNISLNEIKEFNNILDIQVGDKLIIPNTNE